MLFEDKNSKYISLYKTIVRFKGKHTANMIQNATELEEVILSDKGQILTNPMNKAIAKSISDKTRPIDFIEENHRCKEYKSSLTLKRGKTGKNYIGCSK